jgi:hypothetical protein
MDSVAMSSEIVRLERKQRLKKELTSCLELLISILNQFGSFKFFTIEME